VPHWADAFEKRCVAEPNPVAAYIRGTTSGPVTSNAGALHPHLAKEHDAAQKKRSPNQSSQSAPADPLPLVFFQTISCPQIPSRQLEEDPTYAAAQWARNQKDMQQADEVSMRLYAELDLLEHPDPSTAPRGSALHLEMVSDAVKKAMNKDEQIRKAMAADKDVFQMFRTKSDADLAEVGLKRVDSVGGTPEK